MLKVNCFNSQIQKGQSKVLPSCPKCLIYQDLLNDVCFIERQKVVNALSAQYREKISLDTLNLQSSDIRNTPVVNTRSNKAYENKQEKEREISLFGLKTKESEKSSSNGEPKHQRQSIKHIKYFERDGSNSSIDINSDSEESFTTSRFKLLEQMVESYMFQASPYSDSKQFSLQGPNIEYMGQNDKLTKWASKNAISHDRPQKIGIKILKTMNQHIFFGLENDIEHKRTKATTGGARTVNMISYKICGGKQLHIFEGSMFAIRPVYVGDILQLEVDYHKGTIKWFVNNEEDQVREGITFEGREWYPFVTFKHKGDKIQFLNQ